MRPHRLHLFLALTRGYTAPSVCKHRAAPNASVLLSGLHGEITTLPVDSPSHKNVYHLHATPLREALDALDVPAAAPHWKALVDGNLVYLFGPSQIESISKKVNWAVEAHAKQWTSSQLEQAQEIALFMATRDSHQALHACMRHHIGRKQPEEVIKLYTRYLTLAKDAPSVDREPENDLLVSIETPDSLTSRKHGTLVHLCVVTAHAMTDTLPDAIRTFANTETRISAVGPVASEFMASLSDRALSKMVLRYLHRINTSRLLLTQALSKTMAQLARAQAGPKIERLYLDIVDGITGPGAYIAPCAEEASPDRPVTMSEAAWAAIIGAFVRVRRVNSARKAWDAMLSTAVKPTAQSWTALMDGYNTLGGQADSVLRTWDMMLKDGVQPDCYAYRALISTLLNNAQTTLASQKLLEFQAFASTHQPPFLTEQRLAVMNTMLHGLLKNMKIPQAHSLLEDMIENGPPPDIVSFNSFIRHYGRASDFKNLAIALRQLGARGLVGDVYTFSSILTALLKVGRKDATNVMMNLMRKHEVKPNVAIYTSIIDNQLREGTPVGAMDLLKQMERGGEVQPNEATYTAILASIYRGEWSDQAYATECATYVHNSERARGIVRTRVRYHILIKACLQNPNPFKGSNKALCLYKELVGQRMEVERWVYSWLLESLVGIGLWTSALDLVRDIRRAGSVPSGLRELVRRVEGRQSHS